MGRGIDYGMGQTNVDRKGTMKNYETVTVETLTDDMIQDLRDEAAEHGDFTMTDLCDTALGVRGWPDAKRNREEIDEAKRIIIDAINDTRAQG